MNVKTKFGTFRVNIVNDVTTNPMTRETTKIGITLSVGGKNTCVFIKVPDYKDTAHLTNLKTKDGGCELTDKKISGENTIGMVNLAFTIIREICPHIKYIKLEDKSDFTCVFENGMKVGISMIYYEFAFYQESYYQKRFGAYLKDTTLRELYNERIKGFNEKLPTYFSFNNKDLDVILTPIYLQSNTWKDFFQKLYTMPNVCQIMFPWYRDAMTEIFKGVSFERQTWVIDMYNNPKLFDVEYTKLNVGGRKSRKNIVYKYDIYNSDEYIEKPFYEDIYNMKYNISKIH
jgi:hypothetical protein